MSKKERKIFYAINIYNLVRQKLLKTHKLNDGLVEKIKLPTETTTVELVAYRNKQVSKSILMLTEPLLVISLRKTVNSQLEENEVVVDTVEEIESLIKEIMEKSSILKEDKEAIKKLAKSKSNTQ